MPAISRMIRKRVMALSGVESLRVLFWESRSFGFFQFIPKSEIKPKIILEVFMMPGMVIGAYNIFIDKMVWIYWVYINIQVIDHATDAHNDQ